MRAYFGPMSSIGTRENSPEIVVIEINEDAQSCSMGPVCDLLRGGGRAVLSHLTSFGFVFTTKFDI